MRGLTLTHRPLNIARIIYAPNRRVYGFSFSVTDPDAAVSSVLELMKSLDAKIVFMLLSPEVHGGGPASLVVISDFTDSKHDPVEVLERASELKGVEPSVVPIEPVFNGLVVEDKHFPLFMGPERVLILDETLLKGVIQGIRKRFGSAGEAILFYQGKESGRYYAELIPRLFGSALTADHPSLARMVEAFLRTMGMGLVVIEKLDPVRGYARITVADSLECCVGKGSDEPYSHFLRGIFAGIFERVFGSEVEVRETMCIAKGDEVCEFQVIKKQSP